MASGGWTTPEHEEQHNRSAPEATLGQLQGAARQASLHPKSGWKTTPVGIASLEDKIVQYALVKILNAVYENDFMGFSYGFRPGRSQHDALDALATGLVRTNVNWVLDADISQFFDRVSHEWLIQVHRASDRRPERNQAHT
uniref:Retron-type RNA-directed DNA polymerase n=1 Tax=Klebsiella pneumoniae TaxID=573 RepID=A0A482M750_KLEPN|nr:Retron-type RNA-directed DNA polymerase [Klebsiella pneumoniae]